jgi:hypothetical protein
MIDIIRYELNKLRHEFNFIKEFNVNQWFNSDNNCCLFIELTLNTHKYLMYKLTGQSIEDLFNSQFAWLRGNFTVELAIKLEDN